MGPRFYQGGELYSSLYSLLVVVNLMSGGTDGMAREGVNLSTTLGHTTQLSSTGLQLAFSSRQ